MNGPAFALIGRQHSSDTFEQLFRASQAARAARRDEPRQRDGERRWRYGGEPILLPVRLPN